MKPLGITRTHSFGEHESMRSHLPAAHKRSLLFILYTIPFYFNIRYRYEIIIGEAKKMYEGGIVS